MLSRFNRVTISIMCLLAVFLTMATGAPGTVLCIANDHVAVEMEHAGVCFHCPRIPVARVESPADNNICSPGCGSCFDISLSSAVSFPVTRTWYFSALKVLDSNIQMYGHLAGFSDFTSADSFRSEGPGDTTLHVVSTTILRI
jgi:hypothetical protein